MDSAYIINTESSLTLTAKWDKIVYNITLNLAGGIVADNTSDIILSGTIGETINLPAITKIGCHISSIDFDNSTYQYSENTITIGYLDTSASILWEPNDYSIVYNSNNAYAEGSMPNTTFHYGDSVTLPANVFTCPGFQFGGWALEPTSRTPDYLDGETYLLNVLNNIQLYAVWYELLPNIQDILQNDILNKVILESDNGISEATRLSVDNLDAESCSQLSIHGINTAFVINMDINQTGFTLESDCQLKLRLVEDATFMYKDIYLIRDGLKQKLAYTMMDQYIIINLASLSDGDVLVIADNKGGVVEGIIWLLVTAVVLVGVFLTLYFVGKKKKLIKKLNQPTTSNSATHATKSKNEK